MLFSLSGKPSTLVFLNKPILTQSPLLQNPLSYWLISIFWSTPTPNKILNPFRAGNIQYVSVFPTVMAHLINAHLINVLTLMNYSETEEAWGYKNSRKAKKTKMYFHIKLLCIKPTSSVCPWKMKKWPDITMVRTRYPDSSLESKTLKGRRRKICKR